MKRFLFLVSLFLALRTEAQHNGPYPGIPVNPIGNGSGLTNVATAASSYLNALNYGVVGDGHTDDSFALSNCIVIASAVGKGVYVPPGIYAMSNMVPVTCPLTGAGPQQTIFIDWNGGINSPQMLFQANALNVGMGNFQITNGLSYLTSSGAYQLEIGLTNGSICTNLTTVNILCYGDSDAFYGDSAQGNHWWTDYGSILNSKWDCWRVGNNGHIGTPAWYVIAHGTRFVNYGPRESWALSEPFHAFNWVAISGQLLELGCDTYINTNGFQITANPPAAYINIDSLAGGNSAGTIQIEGCIFSGLPIGSKVFCDQTQGGDWIFGANNSFANGYSPYNDQGFNDQPDQILPEPANVTDTTYVPQQQAFGNTQNPQNFPWNTSPYPGTETNWTLINSNGIMGFAATNVAGSSITWRPLWGGQTAYVGSFTGNAGGLTNVIGIVGIVYTNLAKCTTGTNAIHYTVPAGMTNSYAVNGFVSVTALSLDVTQPKVIWTDENGTVQTVSLGSSISGTGYNNLPNTFIRAKGGTVIDLTNTLTTGTGSITYDVSAHLIPLDSNQ